MKKSLLATILIGLATVPFASATTVGFSAAPPARSVVEPDGVTPVAVANNIVRVGMFTLAGSALDSAVAAAYASPAAVTAQDRANLIATAGGWTQFTASSLSLVTIGAGNRVGGSVTDNTAAATAFNGQAIYLWIFDSASLAGAASSVQMGIFKATAATTPWTFPTNGAVPDTATLSSAPASSTIVSVGGVGSVTNTGGPTSSGILRVGTVPEPSTALLSAMGVVAMAWGRRRKRN